MNTSNQGNKRFLRTGSCRPRTLPKCAGMVASLCASVLFGGTIAGSASAADLSVEAQGGLDSNPHRLSSPLDPDIELFGLLDLRFSNDFDNGVFVGAHSKHAFYPDDDRADWSRTELDLGFGDDFELQHKEFEYELSADWIDRDKNYVSRTTGEDATFGGESITDRYDYEQLNLNAEISYRTANKHRLRARYQRRDKDYADYSIPGLDNFDYTHDRYRFDVEFRLADSHSLSLEYSETTREYEDRRASNLDGDEIPGSDLEYDYSEYALGYEYSPNKDFWIFAELSFSDRSDNGVGYNDSTYDRLYLSLKHQINDLDEFRLSLTYSEFEYDNRSFTDSAQLEEDAFDNDGYIVKMDYKRRLRRGGDEKLTLVYELQFDDYDSSDARYRYDRVIVSLGLRYDLL